jgi:hypothetical protein
MRQLVKAILAFGRGRCKDLAEHPIHFELDEVDTLLARTAIVHSKSFVKHVARHRDSVNSTESRTVVDRYLRAGF